MHYLCLGDTQDADLFYLRSFGTLISYYHFKKRTVWAQGRQPQNVPEWHVAYFELKLRKKWPTQEGPSDSPVSLRVGSKPLM